MPAKATAARLIHRPTVYVASDPDSILLRMKASKRLFDIAVSSIALVALVPLFVLVGVLILFTLGRPVFFVQQRPGLAAKPFRLIKFRSMSDKRDAAGNLLPDKDRLGAIGHLLRSSSVDELPQLINVLKGDMSLVGPRPLLMEYVPLYTPEQFRRHDVKPGLTGLAQTSGRNAITWEEKFALDVWYVDNWSFLLDMKILARTVVRLFAPEGVKHEGHSSMPKFRGSNRR